MPKSRTQLRQVSLLPIAWLSEGKLKSSLLMRQEVARSGHVSEALRYLLQERFSPNQAPGALGGIRAADKDVLAGASEDYMRCILSKSIAEVYRKVTPKYRNEAARKQFFKRLLEIAEGCHLSQSTDRFHELQAPAESDRVLVWIKAEMDRLIADKVDLASEHASRLSSARAEFRGFLRELEEIVGYSWQDSERFQKSLLITSFFPPGVFEGESTWRWGAQWYPESGALNISPPIIFLDVIRKGVLAREAAILLSPKNLDMMEYAPRVLCEQSEYLAYRLLERKNEKEFWSQARHGLRQNTRVGGQDLLDFFQYYEMMVGESLYHEVWTRLKEFGTARVTVSDYYIIFGTLAARPTLQKFGAHEMKLLNLISKRPDVKAGEAARILRLSVPTAMKAIRDLSKKAGLRFTVIVDMRRIGLVEYLLLVNSSKQADVIRVLSRFPYCRQVFRTYGSFDLFSVFDVPTEESGFMREFVRLMQERNLVTSFKLLELDRDFQAVNFDKYDDSTGRWSVHWDSWGIDLRESLSKGESFQLDSTAQGPRFEFDKLDLKILSSLHNDCRMPFSAIGRALGVSGAYISKKINRMVREHVFRHAIWPLKIGAEDWGIVALSCPRNVAGTLARYLSQLPAWRGGLVRGDIEGLLAIVWSPNGELKQLFKAIDDRLIRNGYAQADCLSSIGEWVIARWLPVDPYPWDLSGDRGQWQFDEKKYLSLIQ